VQFECLQLNQVVANLIRKLSHTSKRSTFLLWIEEKLQNMILLITTMRHITTALDVCHFGLKELNWSVSAFQLNRLGKQSMSAE